MLGCSCWAARRSCGRCCLPCCFGMLRLLADIELQCNEQIRGPESSSAFTCCRQVDDLQSRRANTFRCCVQAVWECWGAAAGQREKGLRTLLSTVLLRDVEVAGWHWAAVQRADKVPDFGPLIFWHLYRSCRDLDDLQRERANAFTVGAVSMLCEDVGVQLLGSKTELRRLLSTMLFGGWDAAAVYHAGAVQLHFGRAAQETVLKSCEWKGVPAKPFVCLTSKTMSIQPLLCCRYCSYCRPGNMFLPRLIYTLYIAPGRVAINCNNGDGAVSNRPCWYESTE